ncbi:CheR family methyltransferase [Chthonobacter rhizosphaerae]|uniref:CheR family methyltransferase n=1 Tax=Chthonobacter rhizosphaerae TaxID=2735553 RepID=UPI0015EF8A93|nr:protein-glutamate O-methyltransferase CheR [Chthonobacter rhizosphaerae]
MTGRDPEGTVAAILADPGFPPLKRLVIDRTGHHYYEDKDRLLAERIGRRMAATGAAGLAAYRARLEDGAGGPAEWAALVAEITIGETFFFRFAEQFAALRDTILPEILERNAAGRRIRIWSAGAATGAEAYSLAILVRDLLGEAVRDWRVSIVGTDINEQFLAMARQAVYGRWALRSLGPEERDRWFTAGERPNTFALKRPYASLVRFEPHNLLSLLDGTSPLQFSDFDLVLCRNVLIYFHPDTVARIVAALGDTLAEGGWLLLGHAEINPAFGGPVTPVDLGGTLVFRRRPAGGTAPATGETAAAGGTAAPVGETAMRSGRSGAGAERASARGTGTTGRRAERRAADPARVRAAAPPIAPSAPEPLDGDAEPAARLGAAARASADRGDFSAALAACREGRRRHPADPVFHHLEGLVDRASGRPDRAEAAFRRALFLQKDFVMAHYHLGLTLIETGRAADGRRSVANAARLAARLPEDDPLPEGDGLTAGTLHAMARVLLDGAAPAGRPPSGPAAHRSMGGR